MVIKHDSKLSCVQASEVQQESFFTGATGLLLHVHIHRRIPNVKQYMIADWFIENLTDCVSQSMLTHINQITYMFSKLIGRLDH